MGRLVLGRTERLNKKYVIDRKRLKFYFEIEALTIRLGHVKPVRVAKKFGDNWSKRLQPHPAVL